MKKLAMIVLALFLLPFSANTQHVKNTVDNSMFEPDQLPFSSQQPASSEYDSMSSLNMMKKEAHRRFSDIRWYENVSALSERALWVEYNKVLGLSSYLDQAIYRKKERVEALLAVYSVQKMKNMQQEVQDLGTTLQEQVISEALGNKKD